MQNIKNDAWDGKTANGAKIGFGLEEDLLVIVDGLAIESAKKVRKVNSGRENFSFAVPSHRERRQAFYLQDRQSDLSSPELGKSPRSAIGLCLHTTNHRDVI